MAFSDRPDALDGLIRSYENIKGQLDSAEAVLETINKDLITLQQQRDLQVTVVDNLRDRLMAMFEPDTRRTKATQTKDGTVDHFVCGQQHNSTYRTRPDSDNDVEGVFSSLAQAKAQSVRQNISTTPSHEHVNGKGRAYIFCDSKDPDIYGEVQDSSHGPQYGQPILLVKLPIRVPEELVPRLQVHARTCDSTIVHPKFGSIVRIDGKVYAISCFVGDCHANATNKDCETGPAYFSGLHGLLRHISHRHQDMGFIGKAKLIQYCRKTELDPDDVDRVSRGQYPKISIDYILNDGTKILDHRQRVSVTL